MHQKRVIQGQQAFRATFDIKSIDKEKRTIDIVFVTEREVVMRDWSIGRFREILVCNDTAGDLSRLNNGAPLLDTHRSYSVKTDGLGVIVKAWFDNGVGRATVRFSKRTDVEPVWQDVQDGTITGISVGYTPLQYEVTEEEGKLPLYRCVKWQGNEISLALVQADQDAGVGRNEQKDTQFEVEIISSTNTKNNNMNRSSEILKLIRAAGLGIEFAEKLINDETIDLEKARTMIDAEKQRTSGTQPAPTPAAPPVAAAPASTEEGTRATESKAERKRTADILNAVRSAASALPDGGFDLQYAETLINDPNMTADGARAAIFQKMAGSNTDNPTRAANPGVQVKTEEVEKFRSAAIAGMILRSGQIPEKNLKPEEVQSGRSFQGTSLLRFAAQCLERAGVNTSTLSDMEIAKRAITSSTSDFPVILENVLHRMLLNSYNTVPDTWRQFCMVGSVTDFRAHKRLRPGSLSKLDTIGENGELKNKKLVDAKSESITATTKGNIINISRNMIINDDLGYFSRLTSDLGRAAARTIEEDVYALLAANPTMTDGTALFHANHANLITGAAPSVAAFDAMRVKMAQQKDHSGNEVLDIRPSVLVIGVAQGGDAKVINGSQYDPDTANKLQRPNKVYGLFNQIVETARISGNEMYAFADPSILPVIEVAFLNGVQTPYLEQEQSFEQLGLQWRVYTDYGVGAIDWKGAVKNPGA